jgi:hypothetical protein
MINVAPGDEGVWAPTIRIECPKDYWENAGNYVSSEMPDVHGYIVDRRTPLIRTSFLIEMIGGEVYLCRTAGGREVEIAEGLCGILSDGFEEAGRRINAAVAEFNESC